VADKNAAPKHLGSSKTRYYANYKFVAERNKLRRKHRHELRVLRQRIRAAKVVPPRGSARIARRLDIVIFRDKQRRNRETLTGTVKVNAPSLQMLNKYIGQVGAA